VNILSSEGRGTHHRVHAARQSHVEQPSGDRRLTVTEHSESQAAQQGDSDETDHHTIGSSHAWEFVLARQNTKDGNSDHGRPKQPIQADLDKTIERKEGRSKHGPEKQHRHHQRPHASVVQDRDGPRNDREQNQNEKQGHAEQ
tara:strand:+ start:17328 stop:17756 length:429 start_codon:yes stop_codon:yes gene_type:complete